MKTENLAIILTDIVGYTEATSRLSRKEQKEMLNLHNQLLYPIIRSFGGKVVKTIGDALLLVFRSPTDAMLCSMAMQDALYDFNRKSQHGEELHIRIAASLGEVRIARNDIFGEAVNLTSRIENITPEDEIYLSEAIYLAMNKAEVPCVEVGQKQLKGISEPVRIWQIPRFTRARLVPEQLGDEDIGELSYPYGGAHLDVENKSGLVIDLRSAKKHLSVGLLVLALVATGVVVWSLPAGTFTSLFQSQKPEAVEASKTEQISKAPAPMVTAPPIKKASPPVVKKQVKKVVKPEPVVVKKPQPVQQKAKSEPVVKETPKPPVNPHAKLLAQLESNNGKEMRAAARQVISKKIVSVEVLGQIQKVLQQNYQQAKIDRTIIDALAWYCKVLGQSGDPTYLPILEQVSKSSTNRKLKGYAAKSLAQLEKSIPK